MALISTAVVTSEMRPQDFYVAWNKLVTVILFHTSETLILQQQWKQSNKSTLAHTTSNCYIWLLCVTKQNIHRETFNQYTCRLAVENVLNSSQYRILIVLQTKRVAVSHFIFCIIWTVNGLHSFQRLLRRQKVDFSQDKFFFQYNRRVFLVYFWSQKWLKQWILIPLMIILIW